jgi:hypothetical protein
MMDRPKRLLSIDGGGIRGVIAAEVLVRIEEILQAHNSNWKCLGDYFDFIGGTSTGAILAAGLARGMKAGDLLDFYVKRGPRVFKRSMLNKIPLVGRLWTKYEAGPLEKELQGIFRDSAGRPLKLGSSELKSLVMIVSQNASKGNTYFFVNAKDGHFYQNNKDLPLWQIIRASSAAPTYFPPQTIQVDNEPLEFIDGGMSSYNNPSFQLFREATQSEYGIGWAPGEKNMLLISVGTGYRIEEIPYPKARNYKALNWAPYAIGSFMDSANLQQNLLMRLMSQRVPDRRSGLKPDYLSSFFKPLLTYYRYTISFTEERFKELNLADIDVDKVQALDCVDQILALQQIGKAIAREQVQVDDFKDFLHEDP